MILVYIDETGTRDRTSGSEFDWLYVLTAVTLYDERWHGFEKTINRHKLSLITRIRERTGAQLDLADCEVKSSALRNNHERLRHPLLSQLTGDEITELSSLYFQQLAYHRMHVFSVLVDKRELAEYMDREKIHRKSWELLLELIEKFMRARNWKHQAMMICDDVSRQMNRSLAMKHAHLMNTGTRRDVWLRHICEMPMFVRSELSNGVQLADLCSYNIYRAMTRGDLNYGYFRVIAPAIWSQSSEVREGAPFSGLYVMPGSSSIRDLVRRFESERASENDSEARNLMSSGANPIEPTCGTGQTSETVSDDERLE